LKSIGIAYVLWFFLGLLGIHRFYLNRVGTGILWLLTGGLLGIGWLVDLFLIPGMVRRANLEEAVLRIGTSAPLPRRPAPTAMPGLQVI
jgi:TM2 domain-containing membrane protein YozV